MKFETFESFWTKASVAWLETASFKNTNGEICFVKDFCKFKKGYSRILYHNYTEIKSIFKRNYYKEEPRSSINRYKRAAVLIYTLIRSEPFVFTKSMMSHSSYFIKQRLAVYIALSSILVDYDQNKVEQKLKELRKSNPTVKIFQLDDLGQEGVEQDDFLTSFYKDLEFAEIYHNYDILATANVLGLIVEKCSILSKSMLVKSDDSSSDDSTTSTKIE